MRPEIEISGFVLAGGRSTRLGLDKVLLPWNDRKGGTGGSLIEHAAGRLREVCGTVRVCATRSDLTSFEPLIPDAEAGAGPLGGIVAALEASETDWNLFLAVDLPFVPAEFLRALAERARAGGSLAVIPVENGQLQPACSAYHRSLAPGMREALTAGNHKLMIAIRSSAGGNESAIDVWDVDEIKMPGVDGAASGWFLNINTMDDWERAQRMLERSQSGSSQ